MKPAQAGRIPTHIGDYPIDQAKYPMEVENAFEDFVNESFVEMRDVGVEPFVAYWGDFLADPIGGEAQGVAWAQLLLFGAELQLGKMSGWQSGSGTISGKDAAGWAASTPGDGVRRRGVEGGDPGEGRG